MKEKNSPTICFLKFHFEATQALHLILLETQTKAL
jgi:hypothetical protein